MYLYNLLWHRAQSRSNQQRDSGNDDPYYLFIFLLFVFLLNTGMVQSTVDTN